MNRLTLIIALLLSVTCSASDDMQTGHAVILVYHHVSSETPASTSVTPQEFRQQLDYLADNSFTVMRLGRIVENLQSGEALPDRTVAITFDDAYESVLTEAFPELNKRDFPFTVFVATDSIDQGLRPYLDWEQLRTLREAGVEIGNHSAAHAHMIRRSDGQSPSDWLAAQRKDILAAQQRLEEQLGMSPKLFAFPYGEYNPQLSALVHELGFAAIGQHSGAASSRDVVLPRFPVASRYASLDTLAVKLSSLPLPLRSVSPEDGVTEFDEDSPSLNLTFESRPSNFQALSCFVSGVPMATLHWNGDSVLVRPIKSIPPGRTKYTCTLPSATASGRFHWFSFLWMKPQSADSWYAE